MAALTVEETLTMAAELSFPPNLPFREQMIQYDHISSTEHAVINQLNLATKSLA